RFNDSLVAVFTLTGTGITDASFNFVNENNGFIVGAHIQGVTCTPESQSEDCLPGGPGTTSGFVSQVPEPTAGVLMSLGLVGLTWFSRSRRS
ncbi:MAG: PEP-CTERM sorting domain-containing protein, partial [Myxococcales bacterium]|nr:PEP-CTERM sorting domain-containing protein [Myxococcales bacterium]